MKTLFDTHIGKIVHHKATQSMILITHVCWHRGELNFDCVAPQRDDKGKVHLCNATYTESDIQF